MLRRRSRSTPTDDLELTAQQPVGVVGEDTSEELVLAAVDGELVNRALDRLSTRHRHVLAMREGSGWTYQQIADHEGVEIGTIETLLWRARQALKREFAVVSESKEALAGFLVATGALFRRAVFRVAHRGASVQQQGGGRPGGLRNAMAGVAVTGAAVAAAFITPHALSAARADGAGRRSAGRPLACTAPRLWRPGPRQPAVGDHAGTARARRRPAAPAPGGSAGRVGSAADARRRQRPGRRGSAARRPAGSSDAGGGTGRREPAARAAHRRLGQTVSGATGAVGQTVSGVTGGLGQHGRRRDRRRGRPVSGVTGGRRQHGQRRDRRGHGLGGVGLASGAPGHVVGSGSARRPPRRPRRPNPVQGVAAARPRRRRGLLGGGVSRPSRSPGRTPTARCRPGGQPRSDIACGCLPAAPTAVLGRAVGSTSRPQ